MAEAWRESRTVARGELRKVGRDQSVQGCIVELAFYCKFKGKPLKVFRGVI